MFISPAINYIVCKSDLLEVGSVRSRIFSRGVSSSYRGAKAENIIVELIDKNTFEPYVRLNISSVSNDNATGYNNILIRNCVVTYLATGGEEVFRDQMLHSILIDIFATFCDENNISLEHATSANMFNLQSAVRDYQEVSLFKDF